MIYSQEAGSTMNRGRSITGRNALISRENSTARRMEGQTRTSRNGDGSLFTAILTGWKTKYLVFSLWKFCEVYGVLIMFCSRFNALDFLQRLRGKKILFAGDSLTNEQWQSMLCLLSSVLPPGRTTLSSEQGLSAEQNIYTFKALVMWLLVQHCAYSCYCFCFFFSNARKTLHVFQD